MSLLEILKSLINNKMFLSPLIALVIAQLIKGVLYLIFDKKKNPNELLEIVTWRTGGMPSSHAALVCSLVTIAIIDNKLSSEIFAMSFWFATVVLRDAVGVRRQAGLLAKSLNNLGIDTTSKIGGNFNTVKEIQGHTIPEVIAGGALGVLIAVGFKLFIP